jgi:hypothetical protein
MQTAKTKEGDLMEVADQPQILCDVSTSGDEVIVGVEDVSNEWQFLTLPSDFVNYAPNGKCYLPVGVVGFDRLNKRALVELPAEADSGVNRLWVSLSLFRSE